MTLPGTDLSVSVLQAMVWALIPPAIAMVSSNIRRVWASRPEDLPEEERGLKTVRKVGVRTAAVAGRGYRGGCVCVFCIFFVLWYTDELQRG